MPHPDLIAIVSTILLPPEWGTPEVTMLTTHRSVATLMLVAALLPASGCVVWRIEDQLQEISATTQKTGHRLDEVGRILDQTNTHLDTTNATLAAVRDQLDAVNRTNDLLLDLQFGLGTGSKGDTEVIEKRKSVLDTLNTIDTSLGKLDHHLASLRRTLENIDSTIPFIGFADPADEEEEGVLEGEGAETPPDAEAPPDAETPAPEGAAPPAAPPASPPAEKPAEPEEPKSPQ